MEEKKLWKRVNRLTALTVAIGVVFVALGALLQYKLSGMTTASALDEMEFRVEEYGDAIRGVLRSNAQMLDTLSSFIKPWEDMDAQNIAAQLAQALEKSDFEGMAWFPLEGSSVIVSRDGGSYIGLSADELARDAQTSIERAQAGETVVSGIYDGSVVLPEDERGLLYAAPVESRGQTVGALVAVDDAHVLTRVVDDFNHDGAGGFLHIIDAQGNFLVRSEDSLLDWPMENIFAVPVFMDAEKDDVRAALAQGERVSFSFAYEGGEYYAVFLPVGVYDWYEVCVRDARTFVSPTRAAVRILQIFAGAVLALLVFLLGYDYSVLRRSRRDAANMAYIDAVTGAENFAGFTRRLNERQKGGRDYCLAALNISQFKFINGIFGRQQADQLLCFVKGVLDERLRAGEFFCRDSGDIFYICLNETDRGSIRARMEGVMRAISSKAMGEESNFQVLTYCGAALAQEAGEGESPVAQVLFALESARSSGRRNSICFYDATLRKDEELDYYIESHMQKALDEGEFKLYYQPKIDLAADRVASAEVLVRWLTAEGEMILPAKFIPIFEKNGFCEELDLYVLEAACRQIRAWMDDGLPPMRLSVNQTKPLFYRRDYVETLCAVTKKYGVEPDLITLEVLEGLAMENAGALNAVIDQLHEKGFHVSMDDFGSGYSSLNTLANLRIDELKLDKGFLKALSAREDARLRVVLEETLNMARRLGIRTVVEGVETQTGDQTVHALGADCAQGYFYGCPMDARAFRERYLPKERPGRG